MSEYFLFFVDRLDCYIGRGGDYSTLVNTSLPIGSPFICGAVYFNDAKDKYRLNVVFERENDARRKAFADWIVDTEMMSVAKPDALFMHCLPAHRGEEVDAAVIDGPQSAVWDEAENRLHVQKALMEYLLLGNVNN